jgi:hypothetical protein
MIRRVKDVLNITFVFNLNVVSLSGLAKLYRLCMELEGSA